ncbi:hypothetical protein [Enorma burkinafasonensis]|uniref:hypothetical protein n=1 Tax=Enorma burkinafasonensis TaxID=2590867 RepID=UPI0026EEA2BA|nr:hypothetical protein [Enorma burkinafasonensis]MCI7729902.1 hypothetical protein [Enorma burkinafasonensis]
MAKYQLRGTDRKTRFFDMTAEEVYRSYATGYRLAQVAALALVVVIAVASVSAVSYSNWLCYAIGIFGIGVVVVLFRRWAARRYEGLLDILMHDCDPEKLRFVLERVRERAVGRRGKMLTQDDLAFCDYFCDDPAAALERLKGIEVRGKRDKLGVRAANVELLCRCATGDEEGARRVLAELKELRQELPRGSEWAGPLEEVYQSGKEMLRPHEQWTKKDAQRMYQRLVNADCHLNRVTAQLRLAEYELLHRGAEEARRLLEDPALEPLCPRSRTERDELLARL